MTGWIATAVTLLGCSGVAFKRVWGLYCFAFADALWACVGLSEGISSLMVLSIILCFGNLAAAAVWKSQW